MRCHPQSSAAKPVTEDVSAASGIAKSIGKGMSVAIADYDRDGYPDVFVTNDTQPKTSLFTNSQLGRLAGDGILTREASALPDLGKAVSSMGVDFRDYNNDGLPDIVFTALTGETFPLFRNLGKGKFEDVTYSSNLARLTSKFTGWSIALADFDNDGWKDLFTANSHVSDNIELFSGDRYKLPDTVFVNQHDGGFGAATTFETLRAHRGAVVADFDGGGKLDIVVSSLGDKPEFWRNATAGAGHWLEFKLIGKKSNRDSIGAVVRIGDQWNEQTSSQGYASSSLAPVHFGLGAQAMAPLVTIEWPSGAVQQLHDVKADRVVTVREME